MKVSLFYPPLVLPSLDTPYPSLPLLCAYLKENSSHEVSCIDLNVEFIRLGKHGNRGGRSMHTALCFGLWDPLNPVHA